MNMMMHMLARHCGCCFPGVLAINPRRSIPVLGVLVANRFLSPVCVAVLERAVLYRDDLVVMLLWQRLGMRDRLLRGVVVILMDLLVDGLSCLLVLMRLHCLVDDTRLDALINLGVVT